MSILIMGSVSFGQNKDTKMAKPKADKQVPAKTEAKPTGKMKKDGTPDMRYKENKEAAKPAPKLKKDGTPDMRYKDNKDAAKGKGGAKPKATAVPGTNAAPAKK